MEPISAFFVCLGVMGVIAPMVMGIVALAKLAEHRDRLARMQLEIDILRGQLLAKPRAAAARESVQEQPAHGAHESAPPRPVYPPPIVHEVPKPVVSAPAAAPVAPPAVPFVAPISPAAVPTAEHLRHTLDEHRDKERAQAKVPPSAGVSPPAAASAPPALPTVMPLQAGLVPGAGPVRQAPPVQLPPPARAKPGLEAYIGMKLFVVVGAIALALSGIFLVKLAVDKNYFNPSVRVILGAVAGLGLIGMAQWRRKREPFIAQGLSAAGVVALFASIFAATTLYHFIPAQSGFVLLACVTALAVLLSLQKEGGGALMATLGLIGGFITPLLVRTDEPHATGLFGYLILLHIGLLAVTRLRGWSILAAISVAASSAWLLLWLAFMPWHAEEGPILGTFMLATVISMVVATVRDPEKWQGNFGATALTWLAGALGLAAACVLVGKSGFSNLEWGFFAALVAGAFVLGRMRGQYEGLTWLCSLAVLAMLVAWGVTGGAPGMEVWRSLESWRLIDPADLLRLRYLLIGFGTATALAAYGCQWGSAAPVRWASLAVVLAAAYVLAGYFVLGHAPRAEAWAYLPLVTAAALMALALPVYLRRAALRTGEETLAVYAHGILFLLIISPPMALHHGTLTVAWSGLLPLTALAAWRLRLPALLAGFLGLFLLVVVRAFMLWPTLQNGAAGSLWWNPVVWTYGTMLVSMVMSVWMAERAGNSGPMPVSLAPWIPEADAISSLLQVAASAVGFMLLTLEVRWFFHDGRLVEPSLHLTERGTYAIGWLLMACALVWLGHVRQRPVLVRCGRVVGVVGMAYAVLGLVIAGNPLWFGDDPGRLPVLNNLLYVYGFPAALCGCLAYLLAKAAGKQREWAASASVAAGVGFLLVFVLVTLDVRHGFLRGPMTVAGIAFAEWGTYAVAWLVLGAVCLAAGVYFNREMPLRAGTVFSALGAAFAIGVCGILATPLRHHESVGAWLIVNKVLYVYGAPMVLCVLGAWIVGARGGAGQAAGLGWATRLYVPRAKETLPAQQAVQFQSSMRLGAILLAWLLVTLEVRQFFQGEFLDEWQISFIERGTYPLAWMALAAALLWAGRRFIDLVARRAGVLMATLGLAFVTFICVLAMNPLWDHQPVGTLAVVNWLLYVFGLPAIAAGLLARALWQRDSTERGLAQASAVVALLLTFVMVSLEVRQFFHGAFLDVGAISHGEMATYSMAWAGLGGLFLVAGILRQSAMLRWASLLLMLVTVIKVFIIDMADLKDLLRVLSFAGLGVSLMALAFVYQHYVFRKPAPAEPLEAATP